MRGTMVSNRVGFGKVSKHAKGSVPALGQDSRGRVRIVNDAIFKIG